MECRYCKTFWEIPRKYRQSIGTNSDPTIQRRCPILGQPVLSDTKKCSSFTLNKTLWCHKNEQFTFFLACLNQIKTKTEDCKKCRQKQDIISIARGRRSIKEELNGEKRRLLATTQQQPKRRLISHG